jgi:hypothetical protein
VGAASDLEIHDAKFSAIGLITALADSSASVALPPCRVVKHVLESARGIARVIKLIAVAKNFHKLFTLAW